MLQAISQWLVVESDMIAKSTLDAPCFIDRKMSDYSLLGIDLLISYLTCP